MKKKLLLIPIFLLLSNSVDAGCKRINFLFASYTWGTYEAGYTTEYVYNEHAQIIEEIQVKVIKRCGGDNRWRWFWE